MPLDVNSTAVTVDSRLDEDSNLETQVIFGHLENTLAVRCLARNEMSTVSREIKLVSSGKSKLNSCALSSGFPSTPDTPSVTVHCSSSKPKGH